MRDSESGSKEFPDARCEMTTLDPRRDPLTCWRPRLRVRHGITGRNMIASCRRSLRRAPRRWAPSLGPIGARRDAAWEAWSGCTCETAVRPSPRCEASRRPCARAETPGTCWTRVCVAIPLKALRHEVTVAHLPATAGRGAAAHPGLPWRRSSWSGGCDAARPHRSLPVRHQGGASASPERGGIGAHLWSGP